MVSVEPDGIVMSPCTTYGLPAGFQVVWLTTLPPVDRRGRAAFARAESKTAVIATIDRTKRTTDECGRSMKPSAYPYTP